MSILDDAREGMNPAIRPQDDLFGHVNGTWLDTEDIPADRSSWGPFVQLADIAEEQVRTIIEELAAGDADGAVDAEAEKIGVLYNSFMDTEAIAKMGIRPVQPLIAAVAALRDVRDLAAFVGEFERIGGSGLFGSYVDTDRKDSDRYLVYLVQGGLGLPDESYYREDKFAEIREKYAAYLAALLRLGELRRRRRRRCGHRRRAGDPDRRGPLGARRDPRRAEDLQPDDAGASSRRSRRASTGPPTSPTWVAGPTCSRRAWSRSRRSSRTCRSCSPRCPSRTGGRGC